MTMDEVLDAKPKPKILRVPPEDLASATLALLEKNKSPSGASDATFDEINARLTGSSDGPVPPLTGDELETVSKKFQPGSRVRNLIGRFFKGKHRDLLKVNRWFTNPTFRENSDKLPGESYREMPPE